MAGRKIRRGDLRVSRRRALYVPKARDSGSSYTDRIGAAKDYVTALLARADPDIRVQVGEHVIEVLLATAATLEPTTREVRR